MRKLNSNYSKISFWFCLLLCFSVLPNARASYKTDYKQGQKYLDSQAYEQAIEQFEKALAYEKVGVTYEKKINDDLNIAKERLAEQLYRKGIDLVKKNEFNGALLYFKKAVDYVPGDLRYQDAYNEQAARFKDIESKIVQSFQKGIENKTWDKTLMELESLRIYESSFPDLSQRIEDFKNNAAKYYESTADKKVKDEMFKPAYEDYSTALNYVTTDMLKKKMNATHHLYMAKDALNTKRYLKAYEEVQAGLEFDALSQELKALELKLVDEWSGILYNEAIEAQNNGKLGQAKSRLQELVRVSPGYLDAEELLSELNLTLTSQYYNKAEELLESNDRSHIGEALAYYLLVRSEHTNLYDDIDDKVTDAKKLLNKELEFRISLDFKNNSQEPGADGLIKEQLLSRIKEDTSLKNISILDRDAINDILQEQGLGQGFLDESTSLQVKKIKGIQAGIRGDVIKVTVEETGRERPSYGNSKYKSGTRWVPNPQYAVVQSEVQAAQQDVLNAQSAVNQAQQSQIQSQGQQVQYAGGSTTAGIAALGSALSNLGSSMEMSGAKKRLADAQNRLSQAQAKASSEPMQKEEDVMADYRYEIFEINLQSEIVVSYKIINYATSEIGNVKTISKRETVTDRYIPGDPGKNVSSDPLELPTINEFKNKVMNQAIDELYLSLKKELSSFAFDYYRLGQKAAEKQIDDEAIEYFMRFIYSAPDLNDDKVKEANEYIYNAIGLTVLRRKI